MPLESRLELKIAQKLILTPQLQQAIKLLQMPFLELSEFLNQEMMENPLLEESLDEIPIDELQSEEREALEVEIDDKDEDTEAPLEKFLNFTVDEYFEERRSDGRDLGYFNPGTVSSPSFEQFLSKKPDLYDHLLWQLRLSNSPEDIRKIGEFIIGNLDENGYLRASLEEIMKETKSDRGIVENALNLIQSFDPAGVGARTVTECLILQLKALNLNETLAEKIILYHMDELEKKKYPQIAQDLNISLKEVLTAIRVIDGLEPKPGRNFSNLNPHYIVPDVYLIKTADGHQIIINDEGLPRLRISSFYKKLFQQHNAFSKEDKQFFIEKLRSGVGLIKSLEQRDKTIYRVTEHLLTLQKDFFDKGIEYLNPLTLRDVASGLNLHESTISRVTSNKYLSCSHGIFCFRFLFSSALNSSAGSISSKSVKNLIKKIVLEEDTRKPLSDQNIVGILRKSGISIARRTVAKYRDELGIPSQIQRKQF